MTSGIGLGVSVRRGVTYIYTLDTWRWGPGTLFYTFLVLQLNWHVLHRGPCLQMVMTTACGLCGGGVSLVDRSIGPASHEFSLSRLLPS
jgi:hypothetical protein